MGVAFVAERLVIVGEGEYLKQGGIQEERGPHSVGPLGWCKYFIKMVIFGRFLTVIFTQERTTL